MIVWYTKQDFGTEWILKILKIRSRWLIQASVGWGDYSDFYVQTSFGGSNFLDILIFLGKLSICMAILQFSWDKE